VFGHFTNTIKLKLQKTKTLDKKSTFNFSSDIIILSNKLL